MCIRDRSLGAAIAYTKDVKTKPEYQYVVPIVKQKLDEALEAAETVFANEAATENASGSPPVFRRNRSAGRRLNIVSIVCCAEFFHKIL